MAGRRIIKGSLSSTSGDVGPATGSFRDDKASHVQRADALLAASRIHNEVRRDLAKMALELDEERSRRERAETSLARLQEAASTWTELQGLYRQLQQQHDETLAETDNLKSTLEAARHETARARQQAEFARAEAERYQLLAAQADERHHQLEAALRTNKREAASRAEESAQLRRELTTVAQELADLRQATTLRPQKRDASVMIEAETTSVATQTTLHGRHFPWLMRSCYSVSPEIQDDTPGTERGSTAFLRNQSPWSTTEPLEQHHASGAEDDEVVAIFHDIEHIVLGSNADDVETADHKSNQHRTVKAIVQLANRLSSPQDRARLLMLVQQLQQSQQCGSGHALSSTAQGLGYSLGSQRPKSIPETGPLRRCALRFLDHQQRSDAHIQELEAQLAVQAGANAVAAVQQVIHQGTLVLQTALDNERTQHAATSTQLLRMKMSKALQQHSMPETYRELVSGIPRQLLQTTEETQAQDINAQLQLVEHLDRHLLAASHANAHMKAMLTQERIHSRRLWKVVCLLLAERALTRTQEPKIGLSELRLCEAIAILLAALEETLEDTQSTGNVAATASRTMVLHESVQRCVAALDGAVQCLGHMPLASTQQGHVRSRTRLQRLQRDIGCVRTSLAQISARHSAAVEHTNSIVTATQDRTPSSSLAQGQTQQEAQVKNEDGRVNDGNAHMSRSPKRRDASVITDRVVVMEPREHDKLQREKRQLRDQRDRALHDRDNAHAAHSEQLDKLKSTLTNSERNCRVKADLADALGKRLRQATHRADEMQSNLKASQQQLNAEQGRHRMTKLRLQACEDKLSMYEAKMKRLQDAEEELQAADRQREETAAVVLRLKNLVRGLREQLKHQEQACREVAAERDSLRHQLAESRRLHVALKQAQSKQATRPFETEVEEVNVDTAGEAPEWKRRQLISQASRDVSSADVDENIPALKPTVGYVRYFASPPIRGATSPGRSFHHNAAQRSDDDSSDSGSDRAYSPPRRNLSPEESLGASSRQMSTPATAQADSMDPVLRDRPFVTSLANSLGLQPRDIEDLMSLY